MLFSVIEQDLKDAEFPCHPLILTIFLLFVFLLKFKTSVASSPAIPAFLALMIQPLNWASSVENARWECWGMV